MGAGGFHESTFRPLDSASGLSPQCPSANMQTFEHDGLICWIMSLAETRKLSCLLRLVKAVIALSLHAGLIIKDKPRIPVVDFVVAITTQWIFKKSIKRKAIY